MQATVVIHGVLGLGCGVLLAAAHTRGWYRRPDDPRPHRRPAVALMCLTPAVWVLLATLPGLASAPLYGIAPVVATASLAACAVDVEVRRLPDVLTLPCGLLVTTAAAVSAVTGPADLRPVGVQALLVGAAVPAVTLGMTLTVGGIGLGDVKLLWPLSVTLGGLGVDVALLGVVLGWTSAGLTALVGLARGHLVPTTSLPLGPHLCLGALLAACLA